MMDPRQAIKGLDGYSDILTAMSILLGAKMFDSKDDEQIRADYDGLLVRIKEKQKEARWIALKIIEEIPHIGIDRSGDMIGVSAAVERYVRADDQANNALKKVAEPKELSESALLIRDFMISEGMDLHSIFPPG